MIVMKTELDAKPSRSDFVEMWCVVATLPVVKFGSVPPSNLKKVTWMMNVIKHKKNFLRKMYSTIPSLD